MTRLGICTLVCLFLISGNSCKRSSVKEDQKKVLTIAVAANMQFAMDALEAAFEQRYSVKLETVTGSSGKLAAQIMQGAPYSLFLAANLAYPQAVKDAGYAPSEVKTYARGVLVVWSMNNLPLDSTLQIISSTEVGRIAIANPRNAPYGKEAVNAMQYFKVYDHAVTKLAFGESIAQTNQYILSKAADLGITAKSTVLAPDVKGKGYWVEIPEQSYQTIEQGVIITRYGKENLPETSALFWDFLQSAEAKQILDNYGYLVDY